MKRPFQLVAEIQDKDAEIERLKALVKDRMYELEEINNLKSLLTRAADALRPYEWGFPDGDAIRQLITELRKAAE